MMNLSIDLDLTNSTVASILAPAIRAPSSLPRCHASSLAYIVITSVALALITLATIIGNLLVIASVFLDRNLRIVANCLIVSLAIADLLVSLLVMPLAAVYQVEGCWILGPSACNVWIFFDVLCCTSSIYHLVAIAFDRLWAVTSSDYIHNRSSARILIMISVSWGMSAVICAPPLLGLTGPHGAELTRSGKCEISQDTAYTIFSTVGAFYLPLVTIVGVYSQVYRRARARILKKHFKNRGRGQQGRPRSSSTGGASTVVRMTRMRSPSTAIVANSLTPQQSPGGCQQRRGTVVGASTLTLCASPSESSIDLANARSLIGSRTRASEGDTANWSGRGLSPGSKEKTLKRRMERKRERKAARTLAVVTGTFVCCWLPFFVVATLRPLCGQRCQFPHFLTSAILWLGYINSLLNPMIYTLFNPDFRTAFRKILSGKCGR